LDFIHLICSIDDSLYKIGSHDYTFSDKEEYLLDESQLESSQDPFGFGLLYGGYVKSTAPNFSPNNETYFWSSDVLTSQWGGAPIAMGINDQSLSYSGRPIVIGPISPQFNPGLYIRCVKDN
jgi:hypothetical protein